MFVDKKNFVLIVISLLITNHCFTTVGPVIEWIREKTRDSRRVTFEAVLHLIEQRGVKTVLETGTARGGHLAFDGDGGFTIFFGLWCALNDVHLYSVDISPVAIQNARTMVGQFEKNVHLVVDDSIHYLQQFDKPIDFLYLDSFDFDKENYRLSQLHHLHEIDIAYEKLSPHAVVMIDDCGLPNGGKGRFVIEYLLHRGWEIYMQDYQVIMIRSQKSS
jgi:SAM-dependent methyltransferase